MKRRFKKCITQMANKQTNVQGYSNKNAMGYTPKLLKLKIKIANFSKDVV